LLRCAHRWLTRTANVAAANTSTIVAMGRSVCHVPTVDTMNPIQSPQQPLNSTLLLTIPSSARLALVSTFRRVFSKFDLNLILLVEPQSVTK
jgi:hypothetical protein